MSAPLVKTASPGIYKRGSRYVVTFRDPYGKPRKKSARTLAEARALKGQLTADVARGEYQPVKKVPFTEYALEWIDHYGGRSARHEITSSSRSSRDGFKRPFAPSEPVATSHLPVAFRPFCEPAARGRRPDRATERSGGRRVPLQRVAVATADHVVVVEKRMRTQPDSLGAPDCSADGEARGGSSSWMPEKRAPRPRSEQHRRARAR